ncbi:hypothetical protein C8J27_10399 [Rhodobacter aestuarii]|uniref:Uncharacterized protein n=1 Tax=Rhodobacter aestuarii TaxID=453582 RepID=A0A1N7KC75_9RHOB|nr:hypothetical protein C8J27_10399 [Rhodobacter aestuarii]SIS59034.1 hypothetical protein SAMN05421580_102335 [Rhodobacter aestuarii]SOC17366.1 hypothetical protein SAMN05877809_10979 [Rhodobacter sp. JA431]
MNIIVYAATSYLITAVISFAVIGVIVGISKLLSDSNA